MNGEAIRDAIAAIKNNLGARLCILAVVTAAISWQFLPGWLKLSVVYFAGAPVVIGVIAGAVVGWLWLSWKLLALTVGTVGVLTFLALALTSGLAGCSGYPLLSKLNSLSAELAIRRGDRLAFEHYDVSRQLSDMNAEDSCGLLANKIGSAPGRH